MKVIHQPKKTGKTQELIRMSSASGAYIVCFSHAEAFRVAKTAESLGMKIPFPLDINEFSKRQFSPGIHLLIDNLDKLLPYLSGAVVDAVSFTEEGD
jgi:hypothetical protein